MSPKQHHAALALVLALVLGCTAGPIRNGAASWDTASEHVAVRFEGDVAVATFTPTPTATPTRTPTPTATATLIPAPTDAERWGIADYPEVRLANAAANANRGRLLNAALLSQGDTYQRDYLSKVDGNFTGTTEQILEWAARKWFPDQDRDLFKAQAVKESNWTQDAQSDIEGGVYQSFGILQVKLKYWCPAADCEQVKTSTAFGADVAAAAMRAQYDGVLYTGDYASWNLYPIRPDVTNPTRLRRAINAWYFGDGASHLYTDWSYNRDGAASEYVGLILGGKVDEPGAQLNGQTLAGYLTDKPWKRSGF